MPTCAEHKCRILASTYLFAWPLSIPVSFEIVKEHVNSIPSSNREAPTLNKLTVCAIMKRHYKTP